MNLVDWAEKGGPSKVLICVTADSPEVMDLALWLITRQRSTFALTVSGRLGDEGALGSRIAEHLSTCTGGAVVLRDAFLLSPEAFLALHRLMLANSLRWGRPSLVFDLGARQQKDDRHVPLHQGIHIDAGMLTARPRPLSDGTVKVSQRVDLSQKLGLSLDQAMWLVRSVPSLGEWCEALRLCVATGRDPRSIVIPQPRSVVREAYLLRAGAAGEEAAARCHELSRLVIRHQPFKPSEWALRHLSVIAQMRSPAEWLELARQIRPITRPEVAIACLPVPSSGKRR